MPTARVRPTSLAPRRHAAAAVAAGLLLAGSAPVLHGQALRLTREVPGASGTACASILPLAPTTAARPAEAQRLAEAASVSSLSGELADARDQLRRAVALDPGSGELFFQLGRAHDALGERQEAIAAYCRAQRLARDEEELAEVRERIARLATDQGRLPGEQAAVEFRTGVAYATSGDLSAAERAFGEAVTRSPAFAEAYYNRALVRLGLGHTEGALSDLDRLAQLSPEGHRPEVRRAREVLRDGRPSPSMALGLGAVLPGGGQFYSGRPYMGAAVAALAVAGFLISQDEDVVMRTFTATDPFGNEYEYERGVSEYPRRTLGFGMIAASLLGGALEAYFQASAAREDVSALRAQVRAALAAATAAAARGQLPTPR